MRKISLIMLMAASVFIGMSVFRGDFASAGTTLAEADFIFSPCQVSNCGNFTQNKAIYGMASGSKVSVLGDGSMRVILNGTAANKEFDVFLGTFGNMTFNGSKIGDITTDANGNYNGSIVTSNGTAYAVTSGAVITSQFVLNDPGKSSQFTTAPPIVNTAPPTLVSATINGVSALKGTVILTYTNAVLLSVTTNEAANCRATNSPAPSNIDPTTDFNNMPIVFGNASPTVHMLGITGNQSYYVRCQDMSTPPNTSAYYLPMSVTVLAPTTPTVPSNVQATQVPYSKNINVSWTASSGAASIQYTIYIAVEQSGATSFSTPIAYGVSSINATSWTDTKTANKVSGSSYQYTVAAANAAAPNPSAYASAQSAPSNPVAIGMPPSTPTGLTALAVNSSSVNLSWLPSVDNSAQIVPLQYFVSRNGVQVCPVAGSCGIQSTFFVDTGLNPGTAYTYTVTAQDGGGNYSSPSTGTQVVTPSVVAQYEFDSGNFSDSSGLGNDGAMKGDTTSQLPYNFLNNGKYFAQFNGNDNYIEVPTSPSLGLYAMTSSFWVRPSYQDYAGKTYTIISKGPGSGPEYAVQITGYAEGFGVIPAQGTNPAISAPSNLIAQYGGQNSANQDILYINWQDNASNEDGVVVTIDDGSCDNCMNVLPAHTTAFKAYLAPGTLVHDINVYTYSGDILSDSASTQVRTDGQEPAVSIAPATQWIPRDDRWHQVVQTRGSTGVIKYYIDGNLIYTGQGAAGIPGTSPLRIGAVNPPVVVPSSVNLAADGTSSVITWNALIGQRYEVQYQTQNAADNTVWTNLPGGVVTATGSSASVTDIYGGRVYQVLQLDPTSFNGGLGEVMLFNKALSDQDVANLYNGQKNQFRAIDSQFFSTGIFGSLSEPDYSNAMNDLELLSMTYDSAWGNTEPTTIATVAEEENYQHQRWEREANSYIAQIELWGKYNLTGNNTVDQIIAYHENIWNAQRQAKAWFSTDSSTPAATPAPSVSKSSFSPMALSAQPNDQSPNQPADDSGGDTDCDPGYLNYPEPDSYCADPAISTESPGNGGPNLYPPLFATTTIAVMGKEGHFVSNPDGSTTDVIDYAGLFGKDTSNNSINWLSRSNFDLWGAGISHVTSQTWVDFYQTSYTELYNAEFGLQYASTTVQNVVPKPSPYGLSQGGGVANWSRTGSNIGDDGNPIPMNYLGAGPGGQLMYESHQVDPNFQYCSTSVGGLYDGAPPIVMDAISVAQGVIQTCHQYTSVDVGSANVGFSPDPISKACYLDTSYGNADAKIGWQDGPGSGTFLLKFSLNFRKNGGN